MIYSVLEYLESSESIFPNKTVFADEKNSITYSELKQHAKKLAHKFLIKQTLPKNLL